MIHTTKTSLMAIPLASIIGVLQGPAIRSRDTGLFIGYYWGWPISYSRKGVFHTNFSIIAPSRISYFPGNARLGFLWGFFLWQGMYELVPEKASHFGFKLLHHGGRRLGKPKLAGLFMTTRKNFVLTFFERVFFCLRRRISTFFSDFSATSTQNYGR